MRDSADSAVLGMVGGRYGFEKREFGECFQIGNSGVVGNSGVAHPQRDGVGGQKGTDTICQEKCSTGIVPLATSHTWLDPPVFWHTFMQPLFLA